MWRNMPAEPLIPMLYNHHVILWISQRCCKNPIKQRRTTFTWTMGQEQPSPPAAPPQSRQGGKWGSCGVVWNNSQPRLGFLECPPWTLWRVHTAFVERLWRQSPAGTLHSSRWPSGRPASWCCETAADCGRRLFQHKRQWRDAAQTLRPKYYCC